MKLFIAVFYRQRRCPQISRIVYRLQAASAGHGGDDARPVAITAFAQLLAQCFEGQGTAFTQTANAQGPGWTCWLRLRCPLCLSGPEGPAVAKKRAQVLSLMDWGLAPCSQILPHPSGISRPTGTSSLLKYDQASKCKDYSEKELLCPYDGDPPVAYTCMKQLAQALQKMPC